ncbi:MAG: hypothetical protein EAZ53_14520 [Bacteroidetes bacterium]|nr:MAG: hypothetical protein EAZ53_14520 [Bacteroidota bacterium]
MTKEQQFIKETDELKQLTKQVGNSGVLAWTAGNLLKIVKEKQDFIMKYKNFDNYTKKVLKLSAQTVNNYIFISEKFSKQEIGKLMLITHLQVIAKIENDSMRRFVLKCFKEVELQQNNSQKNQSYKTKLQDVIATIAMIQESDIKDFSEGNEDKIKEIISINIDKGKQEKNRIKNANKVIKGTKNKDVFGDKFKPKFFKSISLLFENEPIDEMGFVALFCMVFKNLKGIEFEWQNELITFDSIKYVRDRFPDAKIRCKTIGEKKRNFELDIEFEYNSYNYITHNHFKSDKNCDLIICWIDNTKTDSKIGGTVLVNKLPPVLSLKNSFETGKIEILK